MAFGQPVHLIGEITRTMNSLRGARARKGLRHLEETRWSLPAPARGALAVSVETRGARAVILSIGLVDEAKASFRLEPLPPCCFVHVGPE